MINGLDLLFLEVNSLEESLAFYQRVLGMEVESVNQRLGAADGKSFAAAC
jgi:catechol 2,3-dioxygenase-like lactoylglutathione lyase family enzyme